MRFDNVSQLKELQVTDGEVQQLTVVRQTGFSDQDCLALVQIARDRNQPFSAAQTIVDLSNAGLREDSIMTLAKLDQLGLWSGEAQAMKLAGLPDELILDMARRKAAGQTVLSSAKVAELRNAGFSNAQVQTAIDSGMSDAQASVAIVRRNNAAGGHRLRIRQTSRRR